MMEKISLSSSVRNEVSRTQRQGGKENPTYNKTDEDWLDWSWLAKELPSKTCHSREDRSEGKTRKKT